MTGYGTPSEGSIDMQFYVEMTSQDDQDKSDQENVTALMASVCQQLHGSLICSVCRSKAKNNRSAHDEGNFMSVLPDTLTCRLSLAINYSRYCWI